MANSIKCPGCNLFGTMDKVYRYPDLKEFPLFYECKFCRYRVITMWAGAVVDSIVSMFVAAPVGSRIYSELELLRSQGSSQFLAPKSKRNWSIS